VWHASIAKADRSLSRTIAVQEWSREARRTAREMGLRLLHCGEGKLHREVGNLAVHYHKRMTDDEKRIINYDRHLASRKQ